MILNFIYNIFILVIPAPVRCTHTTLCDKVCQWLATCRCFSPGTPVCSTNKTDRHDITEILLKVALNTITLTLWTQTPTIYVLSPEVGNLDGDAVYTFYLIQYYRPLETPIVCLDCCSVHYSVEDLNEKTVHHLNKM
jgi:hypothetical protein